MENNEYWTKVRQKFYKQVRETNWGVEEHHVSKPRGRKPQPKVIAEQVLRSKTEYKRVQPTKFFNFN
jgi:hypothetical protein